MGFVKDDYTALPSAIVVDARRKVQGYESAEDLVGELKQRLTDEKSHTFVSKLYISDLDVSQNDFPAEQFEAFLQTAGFHPDDTLHVAVVTISPTKQPIRR